MLSLLPLHSKLHLILPGSRYRKRLCEKAAYYTAAFAPPTIKSSPKVIINKHKENYRSQQVGTKKRARFNNFTTTVTSPYLKWFIAHFETCDNNLPPNALRLIFHR